LVFLTGQEEIENLEKLIHEYQVQLPKDSKKILVCPLFAALPNASQIQAFEKTPANVRKVILATNIAETSLTLPNIKYVVDTGLVKVRTFNPKIGIESLNVEAISKASANQRMGRAGIS
jgi:HrpA-like RNA helicase